MKKEKKWYDYMWVVSAAYFTLGFLILCLPGLA